MSELPERQRLALAAGSQATEATAELLRFAAEGPHYDAPFGGVEVVEKLADALKLAIEAGFMRDPAKPHLDDDVGQIYGAACKFLEGWAG